ncbi:hypothetical protein ESA94_05555 [Lacibacter luteus]|uniref:Uncharacterized protein n=1 Tax=Lacibacter luteus TaxID=2508719 RepID=A0A4Q1CN00_9BACT|nr:hypothetical protein [Lacibacter luteus]RXK62468.1 hypothetical protein ESA94_05555 [Lacibacter luteus]
MERIVSLVEQLQQALQRNADAAQMLVLTNMLRAELEQSLQQTKQSAGSNRVAVVLPAARISTAVAETKVEAAPATATKLVPPAIVKIEEKPAEKIVEVLQIDEEEIEAELEEIRQKAEFAKKVEAQQHQQKPVLLFDEEPEVPTLIHQPNYEEPKPAPAPTPAAGKDLNEVMNGKQLSLNDQLGNNQAEIVHKLSESNAIKDLKKAIGINDRFVFINELFRGDEAMYERSIKTINNFSIYPEAQYWMERELKIKLGWDDTRPAVQEFYALVKRRFS